MLSVFVFGVGGICVHLSTFAFACGVDPMLVADFA